MHIYIFLQKVESCKNGPESRIHDHKFTDIRPKSRNFFCMVKVANSDFRDFYDLGA